MAKIKDKVVVWFLQNVLIPKSEIIDKPGFIILKLTEAGKEITVREFFMPERVLVELERDVVKKYAGIGQSALYSLGKKFGYRYAVLCKFPTINDSGQKKINDFFYLFLRYMEAISFGRKLSFETDFGNKKYVMRMGRYFVCSKNGIGLILTEGGCAGMWSHTLQDFSIEASQTKCQGRGDEECEVLCAPSEYLKKQNIKFFSEKNLLECSKISGEYEPYNKIHSTHYCKTSLKDLIQTGFFSFKSGQLEHCRERYALTEASLMYVLEEGLRGIGAEQELFDAAFRFGANLAREAGNSAKFAMDFLSAIGFGDALILKKGGKYLAKFDYFPWTVFSEKSEYLFVKGLLSGILSETGKTVYFGKAKTDLKCGHLTIIFEERTKTKVK